MAESRSMDIGKFNHDKYKENSQFVTIFYVREHGQIVVIRKVGKLIFSKIYLYC